MPNDNFDNMFASLTQISPDNFLEKGLAAVGESEDIVTLATSNEDGKIIFFGYADNDDRNTACILAPYNDDKLYAYIGLGIFRHIPIMLTGNSYHHIPTTLIGNTNCFIHELKDDKVIDLIDTCKQILSIKKRLRNISLNEPE